MRELNPSSFKKLPGLRQLVSVRTKISTQVSFDPRILITTRYCLLKWGALVSSLASVIEGLDDLKQAIHLLWTSASPCGPTTLGKTYVPWNVCAMDMRGYIR